MCVQCVGHGRWWNRGHGEGERTLEGWGAVGGGMAFDALALPELKLNGRLFGMTKRREEDIRAGEGYQEVTEGLGDLLWNGVG